MEIREGIQYIIDGEAILFTGAGFSAGATNVNNKDFATAKKLNERLGKELSIDNYLDYDLPIISRHFIKTNGEEALISFLKREFTAKEFTEDQKIIATQNWSRIYSANYDNIIESITNNTDRHLVPVTPMEDANDYASHPNLIVHLNGFIDKMTPDSLNNYTKLTNSSYASDTLSTSKWRNLLSLDLNSAKAIFFVGFSLNYDLDISRLIFSNEDFKNKTFFINGKISDSITKQNLEDFGIVTDLNAEGFAKMIANVKTEYIPKDNNERNLLAFNEVRIKSNLSEIKGEDVTHLFFKGQTDQRLLQDYSNIPGKYVAIRNGSEQVINAVNEENIDLIIIHSFFGNGKTILIENIKFQLSNLGKTVLDFNGNKSNIQRDIKKINKFLDKEIVIVIDDYYRIKNELKYFFEMKKNGVTVIVTGRSSIHFHTKLDLFRNTGFLPEKTITLNIDRVHSEEIDQLYLIIDEAGLWGDQAKLPAAAKKRILQRNAERGFSNIMFEILKSNNMFQKLGEIFKSIHYSNNKEIVTAILIVNVIRSDIDLQDILIFLDSINLTDNQISEPSVNEFVDFNTSTIKFRSSVASKQILTSQVSSADLLKVMKKIYLKANQLNINNRYDYLCRELVSFSNFKILFSNRDSREIINYSLEYFESIKNTEFAKRNHFFWLQYAIQKLEQPDFITAGVYFKNAYSLAEKKRYFDTYQIDTHYARYQLEKSIYSNDDITTEEALDNFRTAHGLLYKSNTGLDKHYSIRQTIHYADFYKKYKSTISPAEKLIILKSCSDMLDSIKEYITLCKANQKKVERYVYSARKSLESIIANKPSLSNSK